LEQLSSSSSSSDPTSSSHSLEDMENVVVEEENEKEEEENLVVKKELLSHQFLLTLGSRNWLDCIVLFGWISHIFLFNIVHWCVKRWDLIVWLVENTFQLRIVGHILFLTFYCHVFFFFLSFQELLKAVMDVIVYCNMKGVDLPKVRKMILYIRVCNSFHSFLFLALFGKSKCLNKIPIHVNRNYGRPLFQMDLWEFVEWSQVDIIK